VQTELKETKAMKKLLLLGALLGSLFFSAPANATTTPYTITFDGGGNLLEFYEKYTLLRRSGTKVIVDGPCISACTLVFTQIEPENVCVTRRAIFGFHSASQFNMFSKDGTGLLWFSYPPGVREWLKGQGWDGTTAHEELIWMDNHTARTFIKEC
jgi:hypothetical protein